MGCVGNYKYASEKKAPISDLVSPMSFAQYVHYFGDHTVIILTNFTSSCKVGGGKDSQEANVLTKP